MLMVMVMVGDDEVERKMERRRTRRRGMERRGGAGLLAMI